MNQPQPTQQGPEISIEDAFPIYRKRASDLHDETLLLRTRVSVLEKQLAAAQTENDRLKKAASTRAPEGQAAPPDAAAGKATGAASPAATRSR